MRKNIVKNGFLIVFVAFAVSCQKKYTGTGYSKLNGYWEIEKVILPNGDEKDYGVNATIDFFEVKDSTGFRKKVMPQLDGSYRVNDLNETFSIHKKNDHTFLDYTTEYAKWEEELLELTDAELVVKNQQNIEYHYKKHKPFSVK